MKASELLSVSNLKRQLPCKKPVAKRKILLDLEGGGCRSLLSVEAEPPRHRGFQGLGGPSSLGRTPS